MRISDWSSDVCSSDLVDIADHARLHAQRIFKRPDAVFPARIGIGDHLGMVAGERTALVAAFERLLDALHIIGAALGLAQQLPGLTKLLLKRRERRDRQAGEILLLADTTGPPGLDMMALVVTLLHRAARLTDVRRKVG